MTSLFSARPALRLALLLAVGIYAGRMLDLGPVAALWMLGVTFSVAVGSLALRRPAISGCLIAVAVAMLGAYLVETRFESWRSRLLDPHTASDTIQASGLVLEEPLRRHGSARLVIEAEHVEVSSQDLGPARIMVRLRQADSVRCELRAGSFVTVSGYVDPMPRERNPGERNPEAYYALNNITAVMTAEGRDVLPAASSRASFDALVAAVRVRLGRALERYHTGEVRSYLKGIVLALRSEMSDEQREAFLVSGTFHVIAVSGLHVALITAMLYAMLGLFRLPRKVIAAATIAGVLAYTVLVGASPSVVRAAIMACVVLGARLLERPVDVLQSLGVACSAMLLIDPMQLFDAGFQLSFSAVFAIVTLEPLWSRSLKRPRRRTPGRTTARAAIQLVLVSLAAQVGTLPFTILLFERVSVVSVAANLIIVPLSSLNVALGIATVAFDFISGALAAPYAALNDIVARGVLESARLASQMPGASISSAGWSFLEACTVSVAAVGLLSIRRPALVKACLLTSLALTDGSLFMTLLDGGSSQLKVTVLDVGQGDAIVIESPDGQVFLIDGGPAGQDYDAGKQILVPFFERHGITHLDGIIVTHAHSDHIGGVRAVLEALEVTKLLWATDSVGTVTARMISETAWQRGTALERTGRGSIFSVGSAVRLYVLHPPPGARKQGTLNNISIVCKLVYGRFSMILAGDIESDVEAELVSRYGSFLNAGVLKVAHHGSSTSNSAAFLEAVSPRLALISVGWRNRFFHPSAEVLAGLARRGITTLRTDKSGALVLSSDGSSISLNAWKE